MSRSDDDDPEAPHAGHDGPECSYEAFGRNFFERVVTRERVANALSSLRDSTIEFGPKNAGPAGMARVEAEGQIGDIAVDRLAGDTVRFDVTVPVSVAFEVTVAGQKYRFNAQVRASIRLAALAMEPLRIFIDVTPPTMNDVHVEVESHGLRASILKIVARIDGELRRVVARYIAREIDKPRIRNMRDIDVASRVDKAYS